MPAILFTAVVLLVGCLAGVFWLIRRAPEAHENKEGFQAGAPKAADEENSKSESRVA